MGFIFGMKLHILKPYNFKKYVTKKCYKWNTFFLFLFSALEQPHTKLILEVGHYILSLIFKEKLCINLEVSHNFLWFLYGDWYNFFYVDELVSNDPPNKENPYKSYFTVISSARPIRGLNYRTPIIRIGVDWENVKISSEK